jgi:IclR family acetate operon transcriptional repressor
MTLDIPPTRKRGRPRKNVDTELSPVHALGRGLSLIEFLGARGPQPLADIALGTGIAASTAHRLLATLQQHQFVRTDPATGRWSIAIRAYEVGQAFVRGRDVVSVARPIMDRLMADVGETVSLALVDDEEIIFVAQVETDASLRAFFPPGERGPLHASGCGKAVVATWPDERIADAIARRGMLGYTADTLTTLPRLMAAVELTRECGWSVNDGEHTPGMRCVAAPIFDAQGRAVAAMSISGPASRVAQSDLMTLGPRIRSAVMDITAGIGGDTSFFHPAP